MLELIPLTSLQTLALEPNWAAVDPETRQVLAIDARGVSLSALKTDSLNGWLGNQTVPIIALASADPPPVDLPGADVTVTDEADLARVLAAVGANPRASMVLCHVTRAAAHLPINHALRLESLAYATLQGGHEFRQWREAAARGERAATPDQAPVLIDRDDDTLLITLNAAWNRNALSRQMRDGLADAFRLVMMDTGIVRVVVTGAGPCFCSGGDLFEFGTTTDTGEAHFLRQISMPAALLASRSSVYEFRVHGACIGAGIELPGFAARIVAAPDSRFALPEVSMGLIPGAGGCVSLPRRIGRQRFNLLALTGQTIDAEQALAWGLVDNIATE